MTLNKLASLIAKKEGKKSQARIYDIREILRILVEIELETSCQDAESYGLGDVAGFLVDSVLGKTAKKAKKAKKK